jgi:hypothetical protein
MARCGRALRAVAAAGLLAALVVGCALSGPVPTPSPEDSFPADATFGPNDYPTDELPPTMAPIPSGTKASPACEAAFVAWVTWWQQYMAMADPSDPNASDAPPGDADALERAVFDRCTVVDMAVANAAHPVVLDPSDGPVPYIDYDVGWYVSDTCQDDVDIIGDTTLCRGLPSPSP